MTEISINPDEITTVKPTKRFTFKELKSAVDPSKIEGLELENALGKYFAPEDPDNPFPDEHVVTVDVERNDQQLLALVAERMRTQKYSPFMSEVAEEYIEALEDLESKTFSASIVSGARMHEDRHNVQAIRFGDIQKIKEATTLMEQLTDMIRKADPEGKVLGEIDGVPLIQKSEKYTIMQDEIEQAQANITGALLQMKTLHEAQAFCAELIPTQLRDADDIATSAFFDFRQVLAGFVEKNGMDKFEIIAVNLKNHGLLQRTGIDSMQHAMGLVAVLLQKPTIWRDLADGKVRYRDLSWEIKEALESFLNNPQETIARVNSPEFQTRLDQALIDSISTYHMTLESISEKFFPADQTPKQK